MCVQYMCGNKLTQPSLLVRRGGLWVSLHLHSSMWMDFIVHSTCYCTLVTFMHVTSAEVKVKVRSQTISPETALWRWYKTLAWWIEMCSLDDWAQMYITRVVSWCMRSREHWFVTSVFSMFVVKFSRWTKELCSIFSPTVINSFLDPAWSSQRIVLIEIRLNLLRTKIWCKSLQDRCEENLMHSVWPARLQTLTSSARALLMYFNST